jgi:hypothetical protein
MCRIDCGAENDKHDNHGIIKIDTTQDQTRTAEEIYYIL